MILILLLTLLKSFRIDLERNKMMGKKMRVEAMQRCLLTELRMTHRRGDTSSHFYLSQQFQIK